MELKIQYAKRADGAKTALGIMGSVVIAGAISRNSATTPTVIATSPSRLRRPSGRKYFA